jgi:glutathione S-transferase
MLFGEFCIADAFYEPVVTRFETYGVALPPLLAAYSARVFALPPMRDWVAAAQAEVEELTDH